MQDKFTEDIRYNYALSKDSLIFDLGAYIGEFIDGIYNKFGCTIYAFEPITNLYNNLKDKYKDNNHINLFQSGLSSETKKIPIFISTSGGNDSSQFLERKRRTYYIDKGKTIKGIKMESCNVINFIDFVTNHNIHKIDLLKINIEGGEYELLEYLVNQDYIKNIKYLQIAFHNQSHGVNIPNTDKRMLEIQNNLKNTHTMEWCYPFEWESWKRNE